MTNLPAYIKPKGDNSLATRGRALMGFGAGPHMSIKGGRFTLVDAAGNTKAYETLYADICIVDINDHVSKMYYEGPYDPDNPAPPTCFSHNGQAPSAAASSPQSPTCAGCQWNVWGSKISPMGSKVKACRDEIHCAFIVPGVPGHVFTLVIPPNSLVPWREYLANFEKADFDLSDVVTRLSFEQGVLGTLAFAPAPNPWLDEATVANREQIAATGATNERVGRLDRPRQAALPAPVQAATAPGVGAPNNQAAPFLPSTGGQAAPFAVPPAAAAFPKNMPSAEPAGAAGTQGSEPSRRKRRTKAEMEAAKGQPVQASAAAPTAPFRPESNGSGAFGVQHGATPPADMAAQINSIFGGK